MFKDLSRQFDGLVDRLREDVEISPEIIGQLRDAAAQAGLELLEAINREAGINEPSYPPPWLTAALEDTSSIELVAWEGPFGAGQGSWGSLDDLISSLCIYQEEFGGWEASGAFGNDVKAFLSRHVFYEALNGWLYESRKGVRAALGLPFEDLTVKSRGGQTIRFLSDYIRRDHRTGIVTFWIALGQACAEACKFLSELTSEEVHTPSAVSEETQEQRELAPPESDLFAVSIERFKSLRRRAIALAKDLDENDAAPKKSSPKTKKPGRPRDTDHKKDKRIYEAWAKGKGQYKNLEEIASVFRMPLKEVKRALDRHRKRRSPK